VKAMHLYPHNFHGLVVTAIADAVSAAHTIDGDLRIAGGSALAAGLQNTDIRHDKTKRACEEHVSHRISA